MKRAIFKMGNKFRVESVSSHDSFVIEENVREWGKTSDWSFEFDETEEHLDIELDETGTTVRIWELDNDVAGMFESDSFLSQLKKELRSRLQDPISKGLAVSLNGIPVTSEPLLFLSDPDLAPVVKELEYEDGDEALVRVKIYAGLGKSEDRPSAGWHVFCNGRLILEGDKTPVTGWGVHDTDTLRIPAFHPQFNRFRGYIYFDSDATGRLPWNTTKTGLDIPTRRSTALRAWKW